MKSQKTILNLTIGFLLSSFLFFGIGFGTTYKQAEENFTMYQKDLLNNSPSNQNKEDIKNLKDIFGVDCISISGGYPYGGGSFYKYYKFDNNNIFEINENDMDEIDCNNEGGSMGKSIDGKDDTCIIKKNINDISSYNFLKQYIGKYNIISFLNLGYAFDYTENDYYYVFEGKNINGKIEYVVNGNVYNIPSNYTLTEAGSLGVLIDDTKEYMCPLHLIGQKKVDYYDQFKNDKEFMEALNWMYKNGLTKFDSVEKFLPQNSLTREQASKFFVSLAKILGQKYNSTNICNFNDINTADTSLIDYINTSCKIGLFKGKNNSFLPKKEITKAEAIAVLIRSLVGNQDETKNPWFSDYYQKATEKGIIKTSDLKTGGYSINRYEIALLLYRTFKNNSIVSSSSSSISTNNEENINVTTNNTKFETEKIGIEKVTYETTSSDDKNSLNLNQITFTIGKIIKFKSNHNYYNTVLNELRDFSYFVFDKTNNVIYGTIPNEGSSQNMQFSLYKFNIDDLKIDTILTGTTIKEIGLTPNFIYGASHYHLSACDDSSGIVYINKDSSYNKHYLSDKDDEILKTINSDKSSNYDIGTYVINKTQGDEIYFTGSFNNIESCNNGDTVGLEKVYFKINMNTDQLFMSYDNSNWKEL